MLNSPGERDLPGDLAASVAALCERRPDLALDVRWHAAVPSTMDVAAAAVEQGAPCGLVVVADRQTAGRGRRGHSWSSPADAGLYFSIVVHPLHGASLLTLAAGVGVRRGILDATGLAADLKWPNDVLVGRRKLAGILAEGVRIGAPDAAVVMGVGVNVLNGAYAPELAVRATSLEAELGRPVERGVVLAAVLEQLHDHLATLAHGAAGDILRAWRAASPGVSGAQVEWDGAEGLRVGVTAGVDETGALLIRTAQGVERVIGGEVRWR